jgi:fructosamine-3-kinase
LQTILTKPSIDLINDSVKEKAESYLGKIYGEELLSGMGAGRAFKVNIGEKPIVIKHSPDKTERLFYENLSQTVNAAGIKTPKLIGSGNADKLSWIAIEYIPQMLQPARWRDDEEVIKKLARLHTIKIDESFLSANSGKHNWSESRNDIAIQLWPDKDRSWILKLLENIRDEYLQNFEKNHFVSGDPNGKNWGLDKSGELVLFDWERVGYSDPATDLMAVAFGQPDQKIFDNIAKLYLKHSSCLLSIKELSRKIQVGRAHIIISIVKDYFQNENYLDKDVVKYLQKEFPKWLKETF